MFRSFALISILVLTLPDCLAPAAPHGAEPEKDIAFSTILSEEGETCEATADCMPTTKPCVTSACAKGVCALVVRSKGDPCQSGVGICDGAGACLEVERVCKAWDGESINPCDDDSECQEGTPCVVSTCQGGWCSHAPVADGTTCMGSLACYQGLCCSE